MKKQINCSICKNLYPNQDFAKYYQGIVCRDCETRSLNIDGNPPSFNSINDSGENPIFIDSIRCIRRYRFGGFITMVEEVNNGPKLIDVKWNKLSRSPDGNIIGFQEDGGVYIFMYRDYPFYIGTSEKGHLNSRLKKHASYYKTNQRTYLNTDYFNEFSPWTDGLALLDEKEFFENVFVPKISIEKAKSNFKTFQSLEKSFSFWKGLEIYFGAISDSDKKTIVTLEKNLQIALQNIYFDKHKKDLFIPETTSTFFGKVEAGNFMNDYLFEFDLNSISDTSLATNVFPRIEKEIPYYLKLK